MQLDDAALDRFGSYLRLLARWNERINLTRIVDEQDVIDKHCLDSLVVVPHLGSAQTLVDVGAGAGFPGVPCAIALPSLRVTLVESIQKKCAFLEAVKRELRLPLTVCPVRLDDFARTGQRFDVAISRATLAPPEWVAAGADLVAPKGLLVAMLGRDRPPLPTPPGFSPAELFPYDLQDATRALAILRRA